MNSDSFQAKEKVRYANSALGRQDLAETGRRARPHTKFLLTFSNIRERMHPFGSTFNQRYNEKGGRHI